MLLPAMKPKTLVAIAALCSLPGCARDTVAVRSHPARSDAGSACACGNLAQLAPSARVVSPTRNSDSSRTISVGNDPIARTWRDGADQITFIDVSGAIPSDGRIVSWSFYAQKYAHNAISSDPRKVKLQVFRKVEGGYRLIGHSPYATAGTDGWDKLHKIRLDSPIEVERGDLIGWYYPTQGVPPLDGGVIAFESGTTKEAIYRWNQWHGDPNEKPASIGQIIPAIEFSGSGEGRSYSIKVRESIDGPHQDDVVPHK